MSRRKKRISRKITRKSNKSNKSRTSNKLHNDFKPNLSPIMVLKMGSFGGTYFRPIYSSVTKKKYTSNSVIKEYPKSWFKGIDIDKMVISEKYDKNVNKYKVKCGSSLDDWEGSGWIKSQDPYGWFQWYCRYYVGRRTDDDERQIKRWTALAGTNGRFRKRLINMIKKKGSDVDDFTISPVIRQTLQHWGYKLKKKDL